MRTVLPQDRHRGGMQAGSPPATASGAGCSAPRADTWERHSSPAETPGSSMEPATQDRHDLTENWKQRVLWFADMAPRADRDLDDADLTEHGDLAGRYAVIAGDPQGAGGRCSGSAAGAGLI